MSLHKDQTGENIHTPITYIYADETARLAATGFVPGDVYKMALQLSDATLWILTDDDPITWAQAGGASYTDEDAQDAIGDMIVSTDTIDLTYTDLIPELKADVITQMSIDSDASGIMLSGDEASPGNNKVYGTDGAGAKGWKADPSGAGADPNHAYYQYLAAMLEPDAIEPILMDSFSYAIGAGETKIVIASWNTKLGSSGRFEVRNPKMPALLRGVTLSGLGSGATAAILDPALPTYADARDTYFDRLLALAENAPIYLAIPNTTVLPFLPGAYGAIILQVTNLNFAWIALRYANDVYGHNLDNEISDTTAIRFANAPYMAVNKLIACEVRGESGSSQNGSILYYLCPSTWSVITDSTTYLFRDDFMDAALDTAVKWNTPSQSTAGNVAINTTYQWLKIIGTSTWGQNGVHSQYNLARASGKQFICDVYTSLKTNSHTNNSMIVGWHDGTGDSYTDFAHGILFTSSGSAPILTVFENGNNRGTVGSGYTLGTIYRVRITLDFAGANSAKYEIQGGAYGALGSASWTNITPGTTSSSTTPLYAGIASGQTNTLYVSDVKVI